ncbi:MAG: GtrA family protein [Hyphomicrobiales bacterium]|nr:MAG: GtrA family protein [Hyphomicrobiales bacterium]
MSGSRPLSALFPRFLLVGAFGFIVDAGVLLGLTEWAGMGAYSARVISVVVAVSATWGLHRVFTFRSRDPKRLGEWSRFAGVNGVGAAVNYALYAIALAIVPALPPLAALAIASAGALAVNFLGSALFAFRTAFRAH